MYLAGTKFVLRSDHNPLTHLREKKNPQGKLGRWLSELEEYDYAIEYIRRKDNLKADAPSRNEAASPNQPIPDFDHKIYALFVNHDNFRTQLKDEQATDPLIRDA